MINPSSSSQNAALGLCAALFLLTVALFWPATGHDFINFDDFGYVKENRFVRMGLTFESIRWAFTTAHEQWYLPMLWLSFMADTEIYGTAPYGYHLTNILLHGLNAALLCWIVFKSGGSPWMAAFVAALFALHPTRVEAVAWVTARKDTLSGLFFMLTLLAYLRHADQPSRSRMIWIALWMLLGLLSKSVLVVIPVLLLCLDYWPLRRATTLWGRDAWPVWRPLIIEKAPLFVLSILFAGITLTTHSTGRGVHLSVSAMDRVGMIFPNYWDYLLKVFWPLQLSIYYPQSDIVRWPVSIVAAMALAVATYGYWRVREKHPYLLVGWLWFLAALFPIIRGMRLGLAQYADRFTYLPLIGLAWALAHFVVERFPQRKQMLALAGALLIAGCAWQTRAYLPVWQNSITVFGHAWKLYPNASLLNLNFGQALSDVGRYDEGLPLLYRAIALQPDNNEIPNVLSAHLNRLGRYDEALVYQDTSIALDPTFAPVHNNRGNTLDKLGRREEAMVSYREALRLKPDFADAHYNLANVLFYQQRWQEALFHYEEAVRYKPELALAWYNLGITYAQLRQFPAAIRCVEFSLQLDPNMPGAPQTLRQLQVDILRTR